MTIVTLTWDGWHTGLTNEFEEWLENNPHCIMLDDSGNAEPHGGTNDVLMLDVESWDFQPEDVFSEGLGSGLIEIH